MYDHEFFKKVLNDFIDKMCASIIHYFDRYSIHGKYILIKKAGSGPSIIVLCSLGFNPFSEIIYGYNDILGSCVIFWRINRSNKVNFPFAKAQAPIIGLRGM